MAESRVQELARMSALQRLPILRAVEDVQERRRLTGQVHDILVREWKQDKRWSGMARHLVEDIHPSFRRGFAMLVRSGESKNEVDVQAFRRLDRGLHHHHSIEDYSWFPLLRQMHPEAKFEIDTLETDHEQLVKLTPQVVSGDYNSLIEFTNHLMDHLNREEMLSVPWLLEGSGGF